MRPETTRLLLDTPAMSRLFGGIAALHGRKISAAEITALWVKPGRHFNACYRLQVSGAGGETVLASAYVLEPERAAQVISNLAGHPDDRNAEACAHGSSLLVQRDLLLQLFPFDYRLPTLPACVDAQAIGDALGVAPRVTGCEPIGYRPGMRCQIRYRTAAGRHLYGKTAVERTPAQTFELHQRIYAALRRSPRGFQIARPLQYLPDLRLAVTAEAPGQSLHALLQTDRALDMEVQTISAALADFHNLPVAGIDRVYRPEDDIDLLEGWVSFIAELFPSLGTVLSQSFDDLGRAWPGRGALGKALVHRDFYDKQVLLTPDEVTFLDMDTACKGDAEIDLGNFCAQLRLRGLQFGLQAKCASLERAFLAAYPTTVVPEKIAWYRRSSLLRLACGYALRPRWQHLTPALVEQFRA